MAKKRKILGVKQITECYSPGILSKCLSSSRYKHSFMEAPMLYPEKLKKVLLQQKDFKGGTIYGDLADKGNRFKGS